MSFFTTGFDEDMVEHFRDGFPDNWTQLVENYRERRVTRGAGGGGPEKSQRIGISVRVSGRCIPAAPLDLCRDAAPIDGVKCLE